MIIIILKERDAQILTMLIESSSPIKINELAGSFKVSTRTIRYDLDAIDEFLKYNNLPQLIRKPNVGVKFPESIKDKNKVLELLDNVSVYHYALSQKERVNIILSNLIGQKDYTTINAIAESLSVSRGTIINDLEKVKGWLSEHGLELKSTPKYGIKVLGDEKKIRKAAIELLTETVDIDKALDMVKTPVYTRINVGMDNELKRLFENIDLPYIEDCIKIAEEELETVFSDTAFTALVIHIAIAIKRIQLGRDIIMPAEELKSLEMTKEFSVASNIAKMIEGHFNVNIPVDEIGYITVHLLGSNITDKKNNKDKNSVELERITWEIISNVEKGTGINLSGDEQLFEGLLEHIKPTIYRLSHGLDLKNPVLEEIKKNYSSLFEIVKEGLRPLAEYTGNNLGDEEIGYFVMHFGAALERKKWSVSDKMDVLVVCGTGLGTAKMLSSRLQSMFNVNIKGTAAYHQINEVLKDKRVDLIVSTIPVNIENIKTIVVNPLLTEKDIENLNMSIHYKKATEKKLDELLMIIERHCNILSRQKLIDELKKFLNIEDVDEEKGAVEPLLKDLLTERTIKLNVDAKDWEEAVRIGGELLEKDGAIEHRYIDAMINSIKEIGPYVVIAPGIAMPHARPEAGAKKIGMSLITLKHPIEFGNKENDPVKIVVCLCAVDHSSHLKALSELVKMLENDEYVDKIKLANDFKTIYNLLNIIC